MRQRVHVHQGVYRVGGCRRCHADRLCHVLGRREVDRRCRCGGTHDGRDIGARVCVCCCCCCTRCTLIDVAAKEQGRASPAGGQPGGAVCLVPRHGLAATSPSTAMSAPSDSEVDEEEGGAGHAREQASHDVGHGFGVAAAPPLALAGAQQPHRRSPPPAPHRRSCPAVAQLRGARWFAPGVGFAARANRGGLRAACWPGGCGTAHVRRQHGLPPPPPQRHAGGGGGRPNAARVPIPV